MRSGAILAASSAAAILANYVFLLASGRILGSAGYGSLAALLGLLAVVLLPAGALQFAVSREVSRRLAVGDAEGANAFAWATLRLAAVATLPLMAVALALAYPLDAVLNIDSVGIVVLTEATLLTALVAPVTLGVLQGQQRFHALAALYVLPFVLRLGLLAALAAAGYRLGGVMLASVVAAIAGAAGALVLIRRPLRIGAAAPRPELLPFVRYLGLVAAGIVGVALLTHIDLLIVKARFSADEAGAYGAASAFARVAFFLPATILAVLFPRTAARQARGEETEDILGRSLLATAGFCGALAVFYLATGEGLVATTFGPDFAEGGRVLAPFALAIGLFSLANVLVGYHLSRGERRYAWIVAAGVVVQVGVLALVPTSLRGVVWSNVIVGLGLIAAHELLVGSSAPAIRAGLRHVGATAARLRPVLGEAALVLLGLTAFVCALFWPVVRHLSSTVLGSIGADSTGTVTWLWQLEQEGGYHLLGSTYHTLAGQPFGWEESNGLNIQWLLPYYPAYLAGLVFDEVAAVNLVVLAGFVLSGAAMYLLVRYLGCGRLVAAWAALAYMVFPWHLVRVEHPSLVHIEVLALLVLALVAAARQPSLIRVALVGAATMACWLTSGYFGAMATITTAAFAVGAALTLDRRRAVLLVVGSTASAFAATAIFGVAALVAGVNSGITGANLDRAVGDVSVYGLRPVELVVPPASNRLIGEWIDPFWQGRGHGSNPTETVNYLGVLTIALALSWLVLAVRRRATLGHARRSATLGLVAAFVVGAAFAAPSPILLFGQEVSTPSGLLANVLPAFRVPSRWTPLLMTAIVPLAALGLQALCSRLDGFRRRLVPISAAAVGVAMVVSFVELSTDPTGERYRTVPAPPEYSAIDETPRGILVEYPLGYSDIYRLWQRRHGRPLLNGAPIETPGDLARRVLLDPAEPGTAQALSLLGVTAIGIHPRAHVDAEVAPRQPVDDSGYKLVGRFPGSASVWEVVAAPAPALVTLPGGFEKPERRPDGSVGFALTSGSGVGSVELRAKEPGVVRLVFDAQPPGGAPRVLRLADSEREVSVTLDGKTRVAILVEVPRGLSQLLVKTDPPATSKKDAISLTAPRAERASGTPELRATPISDDPGF